MDLTPKTTGEIEISMPPDFMNRMADRVHEGLLVRGSRNRANYQVREQGADHLRFEAGDRWTAWNVGLNEVELRAVSGGRLEYRIGFRRWQAFCVALCAAIILPMAAMYPWLRDDVYDPAYAPWGPFFFWGSVLFWAGIWPWILGALHKPRVRAVLERIVREEAARAR